MEQTLSTDQGEPDAATVEVAVEAIFRQLREADVRLAQRQAHIDQLAGETRDLLDEVQTVLSEIRASR